MMNKLYRTSSVLNRELISVFVLAASVFYSTAAVNQWPGFRGFNQSHVQGLNLPLNWDESTEPAWTANLPGVGQSSPIVWGDKVYVTSVAGPNKETLYLLCFSLETGEKCWQRTWESSFPEENSDYISKGAPTPAIDADRLYVFFESGDLMALTHDGEEIWRRRLTEDYGRFEGNHGQATSPVLTEHGVVILMDHKGSSFIASFDKSTGETRWKTARETSTAWSTPILVEHDGIEQIVTSGSGLYAAYHPENGALLWSFDGLDGNNVPSPSSDGTIFLVTSRKKGANQALKLEQGRITHAWNADEASSAFGSPLLHGGRAYFVSDAGIVFCYRAADGQFLWDQRIGDATWASPLAADDRIYFFGSNGKATVIEAGDTFMPLAENEIDVGAKDRVYGYAVVEGKIIFRLGSQMVCLTEESSL